MGVHKVTFGMTKMLVGEHKTNFLSVFNVLILLCIRSLTVNTVISLIVKDCILAILNLMTV